MIYKLCHQREEKGSKREASVQFTGLDTVPFRLSWYLECFSANACWTYLEQDVKLQASRGSMNQEVAARMTKRSQARGSCPIERAHSGCQDLSQSPEFAAQPPFLLATNTTSRP
jgi:hypothetical protein